MKAFRLNRLFDATSRRCLAVAVGYGVENPERIVRALAEAAPDALQLSIGQAALLQSIRGKNKPALLLRADVANVHGTVLPPTLFSRMLGNAVEQAVRLDAVGVVASFIHIPGEPALTGQCVENIARLKLVCERFAMPLMIELLVLRPSAQSGDGAGDGEKILPLVRQARELGADIIQTGPTGDAGVFHRMVESAGGIPLLVRADGGAPDAEIPGQAARLIRQGAAGLVCGCDFIRRTAALRALMDIVHARAD